MHTRRAANAVPDAHCRCSTAATDVMVPSASCAHARSRINGFTRECRKLGFIEDSALADAIGRD